MSWKSIFLVISIILYVVLNFAAFGNIVQFLRAESTESVILGCVGLFGLVVFDLVCLKFYSDFVTREKISVKKD
jgi:hypothetical protein